MKATRRRRTAPVTVAVALGFDAQCYLGPAGGANALEYYDRGEVVFKQGDVSAHVMYIQSGSVTLSVTSTAGREAVVAVLGPGDFFGEGCLTGQRRRTGSATALAPSAVLRVTKAAMNRLLHNTHAMSDWFIAHMLARHVRTEEDLIDQLFNSTERRLARALLVLAGYGRPERPTRVVAKDSQGALAEMAGTTRPRVTSLLNRFKKLGFVDFDAHTPIAINNSLLNVVLHD